MRQFILGDAGLAQQQQEAIDAHFEQHIQQLQQNLQDVCAAEDAKHRAELAEIRQRVQQQFGQQQWDAEIQHSQEQQQQKIFLRIK